MKTHDEIKQLWQEYLEGSLPTDVSHQLDTHLNECTDCRSELAEWKELFHELNTMDEVEPPADFASSVMRRIQESAVSPARDNIYNWLPKLGLAYAFSAGIVAWIGYTFYLWLTTIPWRDIPLATLFTNSVLSSINLFKETVQWCVGIQVATSSLFHIGLPTFTTMMVVETVLIVAGLMYWYMRKQKSSSYIFA